MHRFLTMPKPKAFIDGQLIITYLDMLDQEIIVEHLKVISKLYPLEVDSASMV